MRRRWSLIRRALRACGPYALTLVVGVSLWVRLDSMDRRLRDAALVDQQTRQLQRIAEALELAQRLERIEHAIGVQQ